MGNALISRASVFQSANIVQETGNSTTSVMSQNASTVNFANKNHTHSADDVTSGTLPISKGGTYASDSLNALINLGVTDANVMDFSASSQEDWLNQVKTYAANNIPNRKPFIFNAGYQGIGYGTAIGWSTSDMKFLMLYNQTNGLNFFNYLNGNWSQIQITENSLPIKTEVGMWTPTLMSRGGTNPTYSTEYRYAKYYRINNLVYISFHMKVNITNAGTDYACVKGLPFISTDNTGGQALSVNEVFGAVNGSPPYGNIPDNSSQINIQHSSGEIAMKWNTGTTWVGFSGCYIKT